MHTIYSNPLYATQEVYSISIGWKIMCIFKKFPTIWDPIHTHFHWTYLNVRFKHFFLYISRNRWQPFKSQVSQTFIVRCDLSKVEFPKHSYFEYMVQLFQATKRIMPSFRMCVCCDVKRFCASKRGRQSSHCIQFTSNWGVGRTTKVDYSTSSCLYLSAKCHNVTIMMCC